MDGETTAFALDREHAATRLTLMSEYQYEGHVAVPRILELLELYEVRATFFWPGRTAELHPENVWAIVARAHELGHHGYMHERPAGLSDADEQRIVSKGLEAFKLFSQRRPNGYRSPSWDLKRTSPELLLAAG